MSSDPTADRRLHPGDTISRNAVFAMATQLSTAAFTAVLTIYLTRTLGPSAFGTFALAIIVQAGLLAFVTTWAGPITQVALGSQFAAPAGVLRALAP